MQNPTYGRNTKTSMIVDVEDNASQNCWTLDCYLHKLICLLALPFGPSIPTLMKFTTTSFQIVVRPKKASNRILDSDSDSDEEEEAEAGNIPPFRTFLQNIATSKKVLDTSDDDDDAVDKIRRRARVSEAGETLISSSDEEGKVRRGQTIVC